MTIQEHNIKLHQIPCKYFKHNTTEAVDTIKHKILRTRERLQLGYSENAQIKKAKALKQ